MQHHFQITNLDPNLARLFFDMDDRELARHNACRLTATAKPGYPCRVSLQDAEPGEALILFNFPHHDVPSPYRASGPVFVRKNAEPANLAVNELPSHLGHRQLSLRGYNEESMLVTAQTAPGSSLGEEVQQMLGNVAVSYIHVHNAAQGCFHCVVNRVSLQSIKALQ